MYDDILKLKKREHFGKKSCPLFISKVGKSPLFQGLHHLFKNFWCIFYLKN